MPQLNAWDYQPTQTSIFFDLHQHAVLMSECLNSELQTLGKLFVDGVELTSYFRNLYDKALANEQKAFSRFRDFSLED